eukprot:CAMPEP_0171056936 /NCGR_PEP_ID=MMETSP0766_2-20121228/1442_1 /TAXON_ID=439317 /ORGANISM="Gambierdiscus australes, Strain CAWD 149" /LENGTH=192 /DNA_ID=CAMNT_0011511949 /DNA_START=57 /DNA_END=635 /DNA_ORIENTATION=+
MAFLAVLSPTSRRTASRRAFVTVICLALTALTRPAGKGGPLAQVSGPARVRPVGPPAQHLPNAVSERGHISELGSEQELSELVNGGSDVIVKLSFTWCRACRFFMPTYQKLAKIYNRTVFATIVGNANTSCKRYAREVLQVEQSPTFALYSGGRLLETWAGNDAEQFVRNIERGLPTAKGRMREAVLAAGYA